MRHSSIQVSEATRKRLQAYKVAGMSYEDVILQLLAPLGPKEFHALHGGSSAETDHGPPRKGGQRRRKPRAAKPTSSTALQNMEKAYRLFRLTQEAP